jgi:hypothetical protein
MPEPIIRDFDKIVRQQRIAVLSGKRIDVTMIPSIVMMELMELMDSDNIQDPKNFGRVMEMVAKVCQVTDEDVTADWLYRNTDIETLLDFAGFVMEPAKAKAKEVQAKNGEGKNV